MIYRRRLGKEQYIFPDNTIKIAPHSFFWAKEHPIKDGLDNEGVSVSLRPTDCVAGITFGEGGKIWL